MWQYVLVVLWAVLTEGAGEFRVVNITQGAVRGHIEPGGGVYAFYNIPYATAPTGRNRFKAPLDPPVWMHTLDAVDRGIICPQPGLDMLTVQEDCLVANIFVPDTDATNLPVLVYIHGGAFQYGFGNSAKMNTLVRTNSLIVVTFNYRLGAHGYLCLGTEGAPGNAGLKDQVALLRWIQTNIASFGGNPNEVTLFGCSAGSGSIDALTMSGLTTGLFKKAIMDSGVAFGGLGVQLDPLANAKVYAKLLGFSNIDDLAALEEFYQTASFEMLLSGHEVTTTAEHSIILFAPCIERDVGEERVLDDAPINSIKQGSYNNIPLLFGFANKEGLLRIDMFETWKDKMNAKFEDFLPAELYFEDQEIKKEVANRVRTFYFGDELVSEETIVAYIDYFSDVLFNYPMLKALSLRVNSQNDTIYLYEFSYADENSPDIPHTEVKGADHCDQTRAIIDWDKSNATTEYIQMKATMREYWLNFIWNGSPWVEGSALVPWPPANAESSPYMSLGQTVQIESKLLEDRVALWDSIYEEHYRTPQPPGGSAAAVIISRLMIAISISLSFL